MSGPYPKGGMSRKGTTTPVYVNFAEVDASDKKILCGPICQCKETPGIGKDGRSLKQMCVSQMLTATDEAMKHKSPYKAELSYDLTKNPPVPIMDKEIPTKVHEWVPGWIQKWWDDDKDHPPWESGQGYVRRPDVVIVKDPSKPPTQDNIKHVVEIKFKDDVWGREQMTDYETIAGEGKLALLEPEDCACDDPDSKPKKPHVDGFPRPLTWMDVVEAIANARPGGGRGGGGGYRRPPKKIPNLKD